jgi:hypothetical protein
MCIIHHSLKPQHNETRNYMFEVKCLSVTNVITHVHHPPLLKDTMKFYTSFKCDPCPKLFALFTTLESHKTILHHNDTFN